MAHWKRRIASPARSARDRLGFFRLRRTVAGVVERAAARREISGDGPFSFVEPHRNRSGAWIVRVERAGNSVAYLKVARRGSGGHRLLREAQMLSELAAEPALEWLQPYCPRTLAAGEDRGQVYLLLAPVHGEPALKHVQGSESRDRLLRAGGEVLERMRQATGVDIVLGETELRSWIDHPAAAAISLFGAGERGTAIARLQAVREELRSRMDGVALRTSLIHGDFWPSNLLSDPGTGAITGIVDWESAERGALPFHDALHLVLYTRKLVARSGLGWEVRRTLEGVPWSAAERAVLDPVTPGTLDLRPIVLLYWLRQIAMNLDRQPKPTRHKRWRRDNVEAVLEWL